MYYPSKIIYGSKRFLLFFRNISISTIKNIKYIPIKIYIKVWEELQVMGVIGDVTKLNDQN